MHHWTWLIPVLALGLLLVALAVGVGTWLAVLCGAALVGAVLVAVHHAEVVAHRVGEPFGTLVLALAVTAIETALILSMMMAGGEEMAVLPRDAIYAAVMIICTGVVGLCVLLGGLAHHEQTFRVEGAGAGLAALFVMATLTLVLPAFTTSTPGGTYNTSQLAFVALTSAALWAIFIFVQTVRHRDYFIPAIDAANPDVHAEPPTAARHGRASGCSWSRSSRSWAWPRCSRPRSSTRSRRPKRPGPLSESSSPRSSSCPKHGPRCVPRGRIGFRAA